MTDELTLKIDGKNYRLDDFELGELEWLEDELGGSIEDLRSMKAGVRLVYLVKRRDSPEFTLEDARKCKLAIFEGEDEDSPPTKAPRASAKAKPKPA